MGLPHPHRLVQLCLRYQMTPFYFFELPFIMPIQTNLLLLYFLVYTAAKATGTQPKIWEDARKSRSYTIVDFNTAYGIIRSRWGESFYS